jgi:NitT/TauT family transport system ATP-binding protein
MKSVSAKHGKALLSLRNVSKHFEDEDRRVPVLHNIDLEVYEHEFLMLLGPSGSGKSTLLRIMAGLDTPDFGTCEGRQVTTSFVFQDFALFPWLTVAENIGFGLKMSGVGEAQRHKIVHELIEAMGLTGFEKNFPRELSGGMKQRVGIARALAVNPKIVFLDEPFSALDTFTAKKLRQELLSIWHERKLTLVMVTHSVEEALLMSDRIAVFTQRPATVETIIKNPFPRPRDMHQKKFVEMVDKISTLIE